MNPIIKHGAAISDIVFIKGDDFNFIISFQSNGTYDRL